MKSKDKMESLFEEAIKETLEKYKTDAKIRILGGVLILVLSGYFVFKYGWEIVMYIHLWTWFNNMAIKGRG